MPRLQSRLVSTLRAGAAFPFLRRLLCADTSPAEFVSQSYLISTCGLTPSQALKASTSLSSLTTLDLHRADAVRAFLARDLGLSESDVASTIARGARLLCCDMDTTLAPRVAQLHGIGLSTPQIARLLPLVPSVLTGPERVSRLAFYISFVGSFDRVHAAIKSNSSLLASSVKDVVKRNIALLLRRGLSAREIAHVLVLKPRLLTASQERLEDTVRRAEQLGVPRGAPMFRYALAAAYSVGREAAAARMELLRSLGLSSGHVEMAVVRLPFILCYSEDRLRRAMEFLTKEAGVGMEAIARKPAMLMFSIERRLAPRLKVLQLLREKGLPCVKLDFCNAACWAADRFFNKFVRPYEKSIPALTAVYAAARPGKALAGART